MRQTTLQISSCGASGGRDFCIKIPSHVEALSTFSGVVRWKCLLTKLYDTRVFIFAQTATVLY
jgi:hypothetical protein